MKSGVGALSGRIFCCAKSKNPVERISMLELGGGKIFCCAESKNAVE
jgi:hypothetical protein